MKRRAILQVCGFVYAIGVLAACGGDKDNEPGVATPTVTLSKDKAAIGSPLRITYKFQVAPEAKIDGDYSVFVHVIEPDGERLWQDDHQPGIPTSKWTPGQTVEYTRTVFIPNYPYTGDANIRLGLYQPSTGNRLPLTGEAVGRREYMVGKINLLGQAENIFLIYKDGWHPAEVDPNDATSEWQWTRGTATISLRNPKRDATFYLDADARPDLFTPPQQVTIKVGGQVIGSFAADSKDRALRTFPISADQFGTGDMTEIVVEVDRTFGPGGGDTRDLGIRVFHAFVEPK